MYGDKSPIVSIPLVLLQTNKNTVKYFTSCSLIEFSLFVCFRQRMKRMLGLYQRSWKRITLIIKCGLNNPRIMPPALQWNRIQRRRSRSSSRNLSSLNDIIWLVSKMYHGLMLLKRLLTVRGMQVFKLLSTFRPVLHLSFRLALHRKYGVPMVTRHLLQWHSLSASSHQRCRFWVWVTIWL